MAVFAATWSGMPLVYSGQENPNLKRLKFFDKDVIEWNQPLQLFDFYKTILQLSKSKVISLAETFILPTQHEGVMGYLRKHENEVVLVLLNFTGASKLQISVEHNWLNNKFVNAFSKLDYNFKQKEVFELQAYEYLVYATNNG